MMSYCAYADCQNKYLPCSSITFFNLPKDHRRQIWIENSGNPELFSLKPSSNKQFCEKHFDPKYLRRQFTRTVLRKDALPYKFAERGYLQNGSKVDPTTAIHIDKRSTSMFAAKHSADVTNTVQQLPDFDRVVTLHPEGIKAECLQEYTHIAELLGNTSSDDSGEDAVIELEQIDCSDKDDPIDREARVPNLTTEIYMEQAHENSKDTEVHVGRPIAELNRNEDDYDEDKHYLLSLLGYFKELPPKTKAVAKLKILQYLTELQFDDLSEVLDL